MHVIALPARAVIFTVFCALVVLSPAGAMHLTDSATLLADSYYNALHFEVAEKPDLDLFRRALAGYQQLQRQGKLSDKEIITIIDFRKASSERRLWVIDLSRRTIRYHSLVAHGKNSGELFAAQFSNRVNSHQSSLGFFVTGKTYYGKHGLSLRLHGVEKGINDQAEARAIVMHGAAYVSESFVEKNGRLGRSHGCPAIPYELHKTLIAEVAGGTCLFIYYPDPGYLERTAVAHTSAIIVPRK